MYCRLPYFKGLAETRVHLPHLETSMSMAAMLQYMVRIMKMKQLVGQQFAPFKALWFNNAYTTYFFFRNGGGGLHIECQYVGANLFVLINSFA